MVFSTVALRSPGADSIAGRKDFTTVGNEAGEVDGAVLDRFVKMSKGDRHALYRSYIRRLGGPARGNRRMGKHVRLAHMCLLYGLVAIFVISAAVIAGMLHYLGPLSGGPAQARASGRHGCPVSSHYGPRGATSYRASARKSPARAPCARSPIG